MSSNLTDKFISNTYTKIFQKSELPDSEGSENINLDLGLNNDSLTLVNGLGQKIKSFILDVGNPAGATMGYGIYFQTDSMKSSGDFGLRLSSINERGQITSQNKDILISTDNSTTGSSLFQKRRLVLKGGVPGTMSFTNTDDGIVGGSVGTQSQITLLLQGRVSVEHGYPIFLDNFQTQELGLMSGVFKGEGPEEIQIWTKVGNVVKVSGSWRWNNSVLAQDDSLASSTSDQIIIPAANQPIRFVPASDPNNNVSQVTFGGFPATIYTVPIAGIYAVDFYITFSFNTINQGSLVIVILRRDSAGAVVESYTCTNLNTLGILNSVVDFPGLDFICDVGDTLMVIAQQFEGTIYSGSTFGVRSLYTSQSYSTDLRFPIVNGSDINRVWGVAKFRSHLTNNSGYVKENVVSTNRPNSASFYKANVLNASSLGPVDFSYSYILEF